jgi:tetratricopeptide (TPR) repeat protein
MPSSMLLRLVVVAGIVGSPQLVAQRHSGGYVPPAQGNGDVLEDLSVERPHSIFERLEQSWAKASSAPPPSSSLPAGTVSVDELRHPLSAKGGRLLEKGQASAKAGDHIKAIDELKQALDEPSAVPYARSLLGTEYLRSGDPAAAIVELKEAIRLMPRTAANHTNLGLAFCMTGKRDAAERELRESIKLDGTAPQPRFLLGLLLLDQQSSDAGEYLRFAQRIITKASLALAIFHLRHGESDAAQQDLRTYLGSEWEKQAGRLEEWAASAAQMDRPSALFGFPVAGQ